jgi:mannitol/fructose-specific phosphotransferase system IIA component (Ntr-type)
MRLGDFVLEEAIRGELRGTTKQEVLTELVTAIVEAGCLEADAADSVVEALLAREEIGSTGIGHSIAIPHAKHPAVRRLLGAYGHSSGGVNFDALDGEPAKVVFLILWPDGVIGPHLEAIAQVSRVLKNEALLERLTSTSQKREIVALFEEADQEALPAAEA